MAAASDIIAEVATPLTGLPVFITGSLVAEETYGLSDAHDDVDLFCATPEALAVAATLLSKEGYERDDRNARVFARWMVDGMGDWHTNSIKLKDDLSGIKVNLVYKTVKRVPINSLAAVLESFDFGLLATGYDLRDGLVKRDLRSFLFPLVQDINGPLPLVPNKRDAWREGWISQYNGLREMGRYAKYVKYGYDMSLVKPDLLAGYDKIAAHWEMSDRQDMVLLGQIFRKAHEQIEDDKIDELIASSKVIPMLDAFDEILAAME